MKLKEITDQAKQYFGKDRTLLKEKILSFKFDGKQYKAWKRHFKQITNQPFDVRYKMFDDVTDWITQGESDKVDWHWLGDVSWEIEIVLNEGMDKGYDWDKKLAKKCGGTVRFLQIFVSDVLPCYTIDIYYMTYSKKDNFYEFGPITQLSKQEQQEIEQVKHFFKKQGYRYLSPKHSLKKYKELYSDINQEGNASLYNVLFSDTGVYQEEILRFNDKYLKDPAEKKISWREYYQEPEKLEKRLEYLFYPSGNVQCTTTDSKGRIVEVKVWRDIDGESHREFVLDILKEQQNRKKTQQKKRKKKDK